MRFDRLILALLFGVLPVAAWPGSTSYEAAKFLVLALAVGALLLNSARRIALVESCPLPTGNEFGPWFVLLVVIALSGALGAEPGPVVRTWLLTAAWVLVLWFTCSRTLELSHARRLLQALVGGGMVTSLYGLAQIKGLAPGPDPAIGVLPGISTFGNENQMAGLAAVLLWPALALVLLAPGQRGTMLASVAAVVLAAAVSAADATGPRLAVVGALAVVAPCWLLSRIGGRRFVPWMFLTVCLAGTAVMALVIARILLPDGPVGLPVPAAVASWLADNNGSIRRTDWLVAWRMVQLNGAGFAGAGNYQLLWPEMRAALSALPDAGQLAEHIPVATRAHNEYLQALAELGPMGLVSGLSLGAALAWGFRRTWAQVPAGRQATAWLCLVGGVVTVAIHGLVSFPLHLPAPAIALAGIIGILAAPAFCQDKSRRRTWRAPRGAFWGPAVIGLASIGFGAREFAGDALAARGQRAYTAGEFVVASAATERAGKYLLFPGTNDLYRGLTLVALGRETEAADTLARSLHRRPSYEALLALAELEIAQKDFTAALARLARVDACRPTQEFRLQSQYQRGMVHLRQDDFAGARNTFHHILEQDPRYHRALLALGYIAARTGDPVGARAEYQRAVGLIEEDLRHHHGPGEEVRLAEMLAVARRALASVD